MADNTVIQQPTTPGATISTEDIGGGVQLPRSKMVLGDSDVDGGDVSLDNPIPVVANAATGSNSDISLQSSPNVAAVITYTATTGVTHTIGGIAWSYSGSGAFLGELTMTDQDSNIVFQIDITNLGPGFIPFQPPFTTGINNGLVITLGAGGTSITGKVNVLSHRTF